MLDLLLLVVRSFSSLLWHVLLSVGQVAQLRIRQPNRTDSLWLLPTAGILPINGRQVVGSYLAIDAGDNSPSAIREADTRVAKFTELDCTRRQYIGNLAWDGAVKTRIAVGSGVA